MPKGKKKGKESRRERGGERGEREASSESGSGDDASESGQSDLRSLHDDTEEESEERGDGLEERVGALVEQLADKAAPTRTAALLALRTALSRRYMAQVLSSHRATLAEHVARALRRGKTPERRAAAALAPLLALQVGEEGSEEFLQDTRPVLLATMLDTHADAELRADCCSSVCVLTLLLEEDVSRVLELLAACETIFSGGYLKGDGSARVVSAEAGALHAAALEAWALLLPLIPPPLARAALYDERPGLTHLVQLLTALSLDTRMGAGVCLAVGVEHACEGEPPPAALEALPLLRDLARDSNKFRSKRHRKTQRATFRDILKYIEEGEMESERVRVGGESVELCGWAERGAYAALASALGAGLQACATAHAALRAALRLPPTPPPPPPPRAKHDKLQRQLQNAAACKARTISRNKNRDKRSALLTL